MIKSIPSYKAIEFLKKISYLNKRQAAYGLPLTTATLVKTEVRSCEMTVIHRDHNNEYTRHRMKGALSFSDFDIQNLCIIKNKGEYTYLGMRRVRDGLSLVFCTDDQYIDDVSLETNVCDHCHTSRPRSRYYVFKDAFDNVIRVGSGCCKDYFGYDAERVLNAFTSVLQYYKDEIEVEEFMLERVRHYDMQSIYRHVQKMTQNFTEYDSNNLDYDVKQVANDSMDDVDKIRQYWTTQESGFAANCRAVLFEDYCSERNLRMAFAAMFYGVKGMRKAAEQESQKQEITQPNHVEGEAVTFEGRVKKTMRCDTAFGTTTLIIIETEQGVLYKMFTSSKALNDLWVNDLVTVKAVFKEQSEFNGKIYQFVRRPKLVELKQEQKAEPTTTPSWEKELDKVLDL